MEATYFSGILLSMMFPTAFAHIVMTNYKN